MIGKGRFDRRVWDKCTLGRIQQVAFQQAVAIGMEALIEPTRLSNGTVEA